MQNDYPYHYQAHRGGMDEIHENTLAAMLYAWSFPHAIPETDVRRLIDGSLACCHDETLERTGRGDAGLLAKPLASMSLSEVRSIDVGDGERVPLLTEVLSLMQKRQERSLYLEIKEAPLDEVLQMLRSYGVLDRIRFVHKEQDFCIRVRSILPQAFTMTWCSGTPDTIVRHFHELADTGFKGVSEVQIHLPATMDAQGLNSPLPKGFLQDAMKITKRDGRTLQVCPLTPSVELLGYLYKEGVRSFVSNAPHSFTQMMDKALGS